MEYLAISPVLVPQLLWAHAGAIPKDRIKFISGRSKHVRGASRSMSILGECPEWQRGRTVNPLADAFVGSSPTSPTSFHCANGEGEWIWIMRIPALQAPRGRMNEMPERAKEKAGVAQW